MGNTINQEDKLFFRFLKEYNCYKEFIINFHNDRINFQKTNLIDYMKKHYGNLVYIIDKFDWHDSLTIRVKNHSWSDINDEWEAIIDRLQYEKIWTN